MLLQKRIKECNHGQVYLQENLAQTYIHVVPSNLRLPVKHSKQCRFHSNIAFMNAKAAGKNHAVFYTPSGNVLVVPTKNYASIQQFAGIASPKEFKALFKCVYATREKLEQATNKKWYIETIGHDVAHLHIRLVRTCH